eukprot:IDg22946t1
MSPFASRREIEGVYRLTTKVRILELREHVHEYIECKELSSEMSVEEGQILTVEHSKSNPIKVDLVTEIRNSCNKTKAKAPK